MLRWLVKKNMMSSFQYGRLLWYRSCYYPEADYFPITGRPQGFSPLILQQPANNYTFVFYKEQCILIFTRLVIFNDAEHLWNIPSCCLLRYSSCKHSLPYQSNYVFSRWVNELKRSGNVQFQLSLIVLILETHSNIIQKHICPHRKRHHIKG